MDTTINSKHNKFWMITDNYFIRRPPEVHEHNQNYFVFLSICTALGFIVHLSYLFAFWILGVVPLAIFNIFSTEKLSLFFH
jgi:hypothetical protein